MSCSNSSRSCGSWPIARGLRSFGWTSHVGAGDVHVAAQHELQAARFHVGGVGDQRVDEGDLRLEVFPAVRNVHAGEHSVLDLRLHDARLEVECGMGVVDVRGEPAADVQGHAGVAAGAMPVARISFDRTALRDLIELRLDLLQADHVGLFRGRPGRELLVPRADSVHIPGSDFHGARIVSAAADCCNISGGLMRKYITFFCF